jgi:hypothetical protein
LELEEEVSAIKSVMGIVSVAGRLDGTEGGWMDGGKRRASPEEGTK